MKKDLTFYFQAIFSMQKWLLGNSKKMAPQEKKNLKRQTNYKCHHAKVYVHRVQVGKAGVEVCVSNTVLL